MTSLQWTALVGLIALTGIGTGCAGLPPMLVRETIAPTRQQPGLPEGTGELLVYSATRLTESDYSEYPVHTAYYLYSSSDAAGRRVSNRSGLFGKDPIRLSLPPGKYRVKALGAGTGFVLVPVIVESRRTTIVDLDGTAVPQVPLVGALLSGAD